MNSKNKHKKTQINTKTQKKTRKHKKKLPGTAFSKGTKITSSLNESKNEIQDLLYDFFNIDHIRLTIKLNQKHFLILVNHKHMNV